MTPVLLLDTEASSPEPTTARLISAYVALVDLDDPTLTPIREQEWVAWPGPDFVMPDDAAKVHGYTTERLRAEQTHPTWEAALQVIRIVEAEKVPVVGYNLGYDFSLLYHEALRANLPTAPLESATILDSYILWHLTEPKRRGGRKLVDAIAAHHVHPDGSDYHQARFDAIAAGLVFQRQLQHDRCKGIPLDVIAEAMSSTYARIQLERQAWVRSTKDPNYKATTEWPIQGRRTA